MTNSGLREAKNAGLATTGAFVVVSMAAAIDPVWFKPDTPLLVLLTD